MQWIKWFQTDPKIKMQKFIATIHERGLMPELLSAIENERNGNPQTGNISVKRVGQYARQEPLTDHDKNIFKAKLSAAFEDESSSPVSEPSDEEIEKAAEEAAIKEGFPNLTGGAFEATYADLHNVYKKGYRAALQSKGSEEKQK